MGEGVVGARAVCIAGHYFYSVSFEPTLAPHGFNTDAIDFFPSGSRPSNPQLSPFTLVLSRQRHPSPLDFLLSFLAKFSTLVIYYNYRVVLQLQIFLFFFLFELLWLSFAHT